MATKCTCGTEQICELEDFCDQFSVESFVETIWTCLTENLFLLNKFVPKSSNHGIIQLRQWKQASYNCAKTTQSSADWSRYKELKHAKGILNSI